MLWLKEWSEALYRSTPRIADHEPCHATSTKSHLPKPRGGKRARASIATRYCTFDILSRFRKPLSELCKALCCANNITLIRLRLSFQLYRHKIALRTRLATWMLQLGAFGSVFAQNVSWIGCFRLKGDRGLVIFGYMTLDYSLSQPDKLCMA